jgi:hypothetical protein
MEEHVRPITASPTAVLPRLLPAPQSFLKTDRPFRLPPENAVVVGVYSGNHSQTLNFFPALMHDIDELPRFTVKTMCIERTRETPRKGFLTGFNQGAMITPKLFGPMNILAWIGVIAFIVLFVVSIVVQDGTAVISLGLLALTSTLSGLGSLWRVDLQRRDARRDVPPGDVVIVGRQGSFMVVKCSEDVARELYFGLERCRYIINDRRFRILAGASTFMFMAAVVLLANCTWALQLSIGMTYIFLNGCYWCAALLPPGFQWDLSAYQVVEGEEVTTRSYTATLVETIRMTKFTRWVRIAGAVPQTETWDKWLVEAKKAVSDGKFEEWDAERRLSELLAEGKSLEGPMMSPVSTLHEEWIY